MKKYLFICDRIPPEHSATGRITYEIAKHMAKTDEVYLVCLTSSNVYDSSLYGNLKVISVLDRHGIYQKLVFESLKKRGIIKLLYKVAYKLYYAYAVKKGLSDVGSHKAKILNVCRNIVKYNGVNTVISSSNPFENQEIAYEIVKENTEIKWYPYLMDSSRNNAVRKINPEFEERLLDKAQKIFTVPSLEFDLEFCKKYTEKRVMRDWPIIPSNVRNLANSENERITFLFAGLFYEQIRNPKKLLELFTRLPDNYMLVLFSRGCRDLINSYKYKLQDRLIVHEFVSQNELEIEISKADFVVSVGNTVLNQAPSKIYDMISYGKPILSFYQSEEDITIKQLAKSPIALQMLYESNEANADAIVDWVGKMRGKFLTYDEATTNFENLRMDAVCEHIRNVCNL